jgi:hypothetical protein
MPAARGDTRSRHVSDPAVGEGGKPDELQLTALRKALANMSSALACAGLLALREGGEQCIYSPQECGWSPPASCGPTPHSRGGAGRDPPS